MDYTPDHPLDADEWLAIEEDERLYAIQRWVSTQIGIPPEDCIRTAAPILAIENQIAGNDPAVTGETLARLLDAGIDRTTAIQVLSDVFSDRLNDAALKGREYNPDAYAEALRGIDPDEIPLGEPDDDDPWEAAASAPEFSPNHRQVLIEFAERHAGEKALSWPETAGFLFEVLACPELIMPSEWTERVQGDAVFTDADEARTVTEARMALVNWISDRIRDGVPAIPDDCRPDAGPMEILETDNNFSRWCRGASSGHRWLDDLWNERVPADNEDDRSLGMAIIILSFFADREIAEKIVEQMALESGSEDVTLEEAADKYHQLTGLAVLEIAATGTKYRGMPSAPPTRNPVRSEKVGRNQPCPCGSGKKYKKCCGRPGAQRYH